MSTALPIERNMHAGRQFLGASVFVVGCLLIMTTALPSLSYMRGAGSMAGGVLIVVLAHIYLSGMVGVHFKHWAGGAAAATAGLAMFAVVTASSGISLLSFVEANVSRTIGSTLFFGLFVASAYVIARGAYMLPNRVLNGAIDFAFAVLVVAGIAGIVHFSPFSGTAAKAVLFFNEPSHFSLSFLPVLFYKTIQAAPKRRMLLIAFGFVFAVLLESLTLIVGSILICAAALRIRHFAILSPLLFIALAYISLDYYTNRLNFSQGTDNLSTLVYLSGWERAYLDFVDTSGVGVGFQQFGIIGRHGVFSDLIIALVGKRLNVLDGGSVGAKFIGEFGVLGIVILAAYAAGLLRIIRVFRATSDSGGSPLEVYQTFFASCFVMFSIDIFVRGFAYFSPSGLFFMAALLSMAADRAMRSQLRRDAA